jgi:quercetin dioxygenase-like cupin family protein
MIVPWVEAKSVEAIPGLIRRTIATGERMMLVEVRAQSGVVLPTHIHPHEQVGYVVSGEMVMTIEGVENVVRAGDSYAIGSDIPHSARFLVKTVVIDVFSPPREDYRA